MVALCFFSSDESNFSRICTVHLALSYDPYSSAFVGRLLQGRMEVIIQDHYFAIQLTNMNIRYLV